MNKSCCIFFHEGYIGVAPTVINLANSLSVQGGYFVIIYATKNDYPKFNFQSDKIITVYFPKGFDIPLINICYKLLIKIDKFNNLIPFIEAIIFLFQVFLHRLNNYKFINKENNINVGIDTNGSILSLIYFYICRQIIVYLSLEITPLSSFGKISKVLKYLECIAYRKAECVVIQDEDRFKSLCDYNNFQHPKVFYLPNSTSSIDDDSADKNDENNYFRNIFDLSKDDFPNLVIQAGMICDEVYSQELAQAFNSIRNGCSLIFHERRKRSAEEAYIKSLQEINSKNLFLSLEPLPYEEVDKVFASATIGLAFYRDVNNNYGQIAKASGKLSFYLKHGKPVLVNNLESLATLVNKYKIGVVVHNPTDLVEIQSAIEEILNNYSFYCENAKTCFAHEFDFAKKVKPLLYELNKSGVNETKTVLVK